MALDSQYAATPVLGSALLQFGDPARSGTPANPVTILTGGAAGTRIDNLDWSAIGPTTATVLRFWLAHGGSYTPVLAEQVIPAVTPNPATAIVAANGYQVSIAGGALPLILPDATWSLVATLNDTQTITKPQLDSLALAQTVPAGAFIGLNGAGAVAANGGNIVAASSYGAAGPLTLTANPCVLTAPAIPTITCSVNMSAVNFTLQGYSKSGVAVSETMVGPNSTTVNAAGVYSTLTAIYCSAAVGTAISIGTAASYPLAVPSKISFSSFGNLSGATIAITGTDSGGALQTETVVGPNNGTVLSAKVYASILALKPSAVLATNITVGNPPILSGIQVTARGGAF